MHLLQPQLEVTTSLLVSTHSTTAPVLTPDQVQRSSWQKLTTEPEQVDWLILHFNHWFSHHNVTLVKGEFEPEYFPAENGQPARIQFAHGFFNSALHEISHWTISGAQRRLLPIWVIGMHQMVEQLNNRRFLNRLKSSHKRLNGYLRLPLVESSEYL